MLGFHQTAYPQLLLVSDARNEVLTPGDWTHPPPPRAGRAGQRQAHHGRSDWSLPFLFSAHHLPRTPASRLFLSKRRPPSQPRAAPRDVFVICASFPLMAKLSNRLGCWPCPHQGSLSLDISFKGKSCLASQGQKDSGFSSAPCRRARAAPPQAAGHLEEATATAPPQRPQPLRHCPPHRTAGPLSSEQLPPTS